MKKLINSKSGVLGQPVKSIATKRQFVTHPHPDKGSVKSKRLRLAISDKKRNDILGSIMMS